LKGDDKLMAVERLRVNQMGMSSGVWRWDHVQEAVFDVKTWIWFSLLTAVSIPSGGIGTFGPLIVKSFGINSFQTLLFNMPFGLVTLISTLGSSWAATHYKMKSPILAALCIPPIIGITLLLATEHTQEKRGILLLGYYLTSVYPAISPLIYSWSGQNTAGDTSKSIPSTFSFIHTTCTHDMPERKVTTGILFIGASAGNIVGPKLYNETQKPRYTSGLVSNLILFILIIVLVAFGAAWVTFLNKRHAAARVRIGKSATVVDLSMENKHALFQREHTEVGAGIGKRAFDDVTDLKNEDFIYVL
jgi:hypothetical protein